MRFEKAMQPDIAAAMASFGAREGAVDERTRELGRQAERLLLDAMTPRWTYRRFALGQPLCLEEAGIPLAGEDIRRHLRFCHACFAMAVTLGEGAERVIRAAQATDMSLAVVLDAIASQLAEQYADEAQRLMEPAKQEDEFMTGRYSPGYGDLPLDLQKKLLTALDAPKAIGLAASESGILIPRKSITAIVGVSRQQVSGHLAGCEHCALREKCEWNQTGKGGKACGRTNI